MKYLLLLFLMLPVGDNTQHLTEVVTVEGKTSEELYENAKEWFSLNFKSADDIIELDDPVDKKLIGKGSKQVEYMVGYIPSFMTIYYTMTVQCKDGRYKYEIQQTEIKAPGGKECTYDQLKEWATEDGLLRLYESMGTKVRGGIIRKGFEEHLQHNKELVASVDKQLPLIVQEFDQAIRRDRNQDDW
ncbi:DUF4468 domain-containing protein [Mangrovibacterium sp.]|uniref:DUF4468 domain-containing protein n=1 Tax=Mangrovibacterium sp. TaxID=1961364 RepID=UPI003565B3EB